MQSLPVGGVIVKEIVAAGEDGATGLWGWADSLEGRYFFLWMPRRKGAVELMVIWRAWLCSPMMPLGLGMYS